MAYDAPCCAIRMATCFASKLCIDAGPLTANSTKSPATHDSIFWLGTVVFFIAHYIAPLYSKMAGYE